MAETWLPGAVHSPRSQTGLFIRDYRALLFHTQGGPPNIGDDYHFHVKPDGTIHQVYPLECQSRASYRGNPYSISAVCEDTGPAFPAWTGNNVPHYTEPQKRALIYIGKWVCDKYNIPKVALRTSCLETERGIGWHRLGIPGNFPDQWPLWGQQPGCQLWTKHPGKACPGANRIMDLTQPGGIIAKIAADDSEDPDVKPAPNARYLPFEFSKLVVPTGSTGSVKTTTQTTQPSTARTVTTVTSDLMGATGTAVLQTASLVAEASGGVIGTVPWKTGGGHYGSLWDQYPAGGWPSAGFDEYLVGAVFAPDGNGYWLVSQRGGIANFGSAGMPTWTTPIWDKDVVGAKRATSGKLVVVFANGTEQTAT